MKKIKIRCKRCIMDNSVPGVFLDNEGECNFCKLHDKMEKEFPTGEKGMEIIKNIAREIKYNSQGKKYNCVVGISGGRDSTFTLYFVKKILKLDPIAVHFNDGFGNPTAGENMIKICRNLDVDLRTITSNWRESKDLKLAFLKASTLDIEEGTDLGIATALYGVACKEKVKYIIIGQSFRTEGIAPLEWNYLDGEYLRAVHKKFGKFPLRKWKPIDPGFNLGLKELFYYTVIQRIKTIPILYYLDYIRDDISKMLEKEVGWKNTGAHYFDDLYQSFQSYYCRVKFKTERRLFNYAALVRSGQMSKKEALLRMKKKSPIEDQKIINLCIKRLGLTKNEVDCFIKQAPKKFSDYPNSLNFIRKLKSPIKFLCRLNLLPPTTYDKYFNCG